MRKSLVVMLILALLLACPLGAKAQAEVTLESLTIQAWPEYDQPSVLVIYDFNLAADTALPVTLSLRLPAEAELLALAKEDSSGFVTVPQDKPLAAQGDYQVLTFTVTDSLPYHVEYYVPYTQNGLTRNFTVTWPGDYATKAIIFALQEPPEAQNITTEPALSDVGARPDNLVYHSATFPGQAAGQPFAVQVTYKKDSDTLTVASLPVQPANSLDQNISGQASFTAYLPWILGGLGLVLVAAALAWYLLMGRAEGSASKARKRHGAREEEDESDDNTQRYCSQCGKRAQPSDRFCRACGARLKRGEG